MLVVNAKSCWPSWTAVILCNICWAVIGSDGLECNCEQESDTMFERFIYDYYRIPSHRTDHMNSSEVVKQMIDFTNVHSKCRQSTSCVISFCDELDKFNAKFENALPAKIVNEGRTSINRLCHTLKYETSNGSIATCFTNDHVTQLSADRSQCVRVNDHAVIFYCYKDKCNSRSNMQLHNCTVVDYNAESWTQSSTRLWWDLRTLVVTSVLFYM